MWFVLCGWIFLVWCVFLWMFMGVCFVWFELLLFLVLLVTFMVGCEGV